MFETIPAEMTAVPNWVCWKAVPDANSHSGIKKIPVNPYTGGQAMSNNPQTWSDFETAVRVSQNFDGIGFMFSGSGYFGIDLDDCREMVDSYLLGDKTGIVAEFIDTMQTYAEISQSGNGIHLICRGILPPNGRRRGKVEMYDSGRYFIMTGRQIGSFSEISDGTERVKMLHAKYLNTPPSAKIYSSAPASIKTTLNISEQELIDKMLNSQNGDKFAKLYSGDFSDYPSQSEADMAFCSMLAFWCNGDTSLMDSIYRSSGLMREKWDRRQNGTTYGAITLAKAAAGFQNFYTPATEDNYRITVGNCSDPKPKLPMHTLDDTGNAERIPTPAGKEKWAGSTIKSILTNEKYKGDALLQKKFTVDFLTKKQKVNEGEIPQYYVENSHHAIITPEEFDFVQEEFLKRENAGKQYSSTSVFASKIICGDCGGYFGAKVWHSNSKYRRVIYQCNSKFKGEHFCTTPHLYESEIQQKFLNAFSRYFGQKDVIIKNCLFVLNQLKIQDEHNIELQAEFDEINKQLKEYIESGGTDSNYSELNARYEEIAAKIDAEKQLATERKGRIAKMQEILRVLKKSDSILETFDENIWTALVETLTVFHDGSMVFLFKDGTEIKI